MKMFFKVTGGLILVIAAGLSINMVGVMQDINLLPVFKAGVFDLSWLMSDTSKAGVFFKALFGYTHSPSLLQAVVYPSYFLLTYALLNGISVKKPAKNIATSAAHA